MKLQEFIPYARKFLVALVTALGIVATALSDGHITQSEWVGILVAFLGSLGVYSVKNDKRIGE